MNRDNENCSQIIRSEDYADLYLYRENIPSDLEKKAHDIKAECIQKISDDYWLVHIPFTKTDSNFYLGNSYTNTPNVYAPIGLDTTSMDRFHERMFDWTPVDETGKGVLVGVLDTGIDYTHPAFIDANGNTKILSIWDQSVNGTPPNHFLYGNEYTSNQINEALMSDSPYYVVPSRDKNGHGTYVAGVVAGNKIESADFSGIAPGADLIVVKLKQAKRELMEFYQFNPGQTAFQSNDIIQGLHYLAYQAKKLKRPLVVIITCASSEGPHNGNTLLEKAFATYNLVDGIGIICAVGNEATCGHHYRGSVDKKQRSTYVKLNISTQHSHGLFMNMFSRLPDEVTIEFVDPNGNSAGMVPFKTDEWQSVQIENTSTVINVYYAFIEERGSQEGIFIRLQDPLPGIWTLIVHGNILINGQFDIWLPVVEFVSSNTHFLEPDPYITLVNPSTGPGSVSVGAYQQETGSLNTHSGRGFTLDHQIKPDIIGPGYRIKGPTPNQNYLYGTGTCSSSAITAGVTALFFQWGIVNGNNKDLNTATLTTYYARGATRTPTMAYPNREWGYGVINPAKTLKTASQSSV